MRRKLLFFAPAIVAIAFLCTAFGGGDDSKRSSGSPGGYTGSPGDGHNCTACHGGSASTVTGWITSDVPAQGYTPGTTYTITATATGSGKKGFEISPQTTGGALLGTLSPGSGNKLCNGNKAITHSSTVSGTSATWTFSWTAPAAGTGPVTFYGAFAVTEPVTKLTTMVVNENATTPLSATATANPMTINAGQSSQLNVTVAGGTGSYSYSWVSNPAGFTSTQQNPVVTPAATTTYTVTVTSGTSNVNSSVTVTVIPVSPLTVSATASPMSITAGQSSQLSANVSGGTGTYSFSWVSNPAGFTSTLQNPVVSPIVTTEYTVTVTSGTSNANSAVTVTVNAANPLAATATAAPSTICNGQSTQLGVNVTGGTPPYTYSWSSVPAGYTSTLQYPSASPSVTTVYSVQVGDGTSSASSAVTVVVNQEPVVAAGIDTTYCKDDLQISNNGTASNYGSVAWTTSGDGTFNTPTALSSIYYPGTGDHTTGYVDLTLTATPVSPCENPIASVRHILFDPCTGIDGNKGLAAGIILSPNPTSGVVNIDLNGMKSISSSVTVLNCQGKPVMVKQLTGSTATLDLSSFSKGVYFVRIQTENGIQTEKVILQ